MKNVAACLFLMAIGCFAACGDDAEAAADELEAACNSFCDAIYGTSCATPGITLDQCKQTCPLLDSYLDGYCVAEYTAVFDCTAKGGVTCTDNGPFPTDPCPEENQALLTCTQEAGCQRHCDAASAAGCPPGGSVPACVQECNSTRAELGNCAGQYDFYLQCTYTIGVTCDGAEPTSVDCDENLVGVGGCLATFVDPCQGYCFAGDALGCSDATACEASCAAARDQDPTCTESYESWVECVANDFEPSCSGSDLIAPSCDFERQNYDACIAGM